MKSSQNIFLLALFLTACTAISQKDTFLDSLPRPSNIVFSDDFESGLSQWNQLSGTWTTTTPAANGLALRSPTSASATTFNLVTVSNIDLTGKSGCLLEYDANFNIGALANVSAKILFGATTVASFKETNGQSSITSSGQFLSRRFQLPDNSSEKLTIQTSVTNTTTGAADLYIDNLRITCGKTTGPAVTLVSENFEAGSTNWLLQSPWAVTAAAGAENSNAAKTPVKSDNVDHVASYTPNINLQGRSGCKVSYFYTQILAGDVHGATCYIFEWNAARVDNRCNAGSTSGTSEFYLTAYEGLATNSFLFRCRDSNDGTTTITCAMDNVTVSCQQ